MIRVALAAAILLWAVLGVAVEFPVKPLRMVVPFPPGGLLDMLARGLGPQLGAHLGQAVVVENRPGANGSIGADAVAKAAPDGHTLLIGGGSSFVVNPLLNPGLPFDPIKDFAPVSMIGRGPMVLIANPAFQASSVAELVALAKAAPGKLAYGTPGNGNPNHLAGELFKSAAGINLLHVPYKGAALVITDVIAGHVPIAFVTLSAGLPHVRSGKIKALAVTTDKRWPATPDLATMSEAGLPDVQLVDWSGLFVPARTPKEAIARLNEALHKSLAAPEVRARLVEQGLEPRVTSSAELAAEMQSDLARLGRIVRQAGIRSD